MFSKYSNYFRSWIQLATGCQFKVFWTVIKVIDTEAPIRSRTNNPNVNSLDKGQYKTYMGGG